MASNQPVVVLPPPTIPNLFPSPLYIRKKPRRTSRRATFYRRILHKSPRQLSHESVCGPLDDIITEISSDIWASPSEWSLESTLFGLNKPLEGFVNGHNPLKAASTCTISTVTPLSVSRIPSNQPLTIRKNRSSRSTVSESSATHSIMTLSRSSSGKDSKSSSKLRASLEKTPTAWPQGDALSRLDSEPILSNNNVYPAYNPAQQALEDVQHAGESRETKRRSSRVRLFPNGFTRLLRSSSDALSTKSTIPDATSDCGDCDTIKLPNTEFADETSINYMIKQSSSENRRDSDWMERCSTPSMPTALKIMINVLPEVRVLESDDDQDFWVGVEIETALHNRHELTDSTIDVVFVVDNGYYVSEDCLSHALDAATGGLHQLARGDRVALYTTHCTPGSTESTVPDRLLPLRSVSPETEEVFQDLIVDIAEYGIQDWKAPRPNPPMASVVRAIATSLEKESPKYRRCHIILLSPVVDMLHTVSETFPSLQIHRINPAILPFNPNEEHREMTCLEKCCKNVFVSNWTHYQSVSSCIKQIVAQARSESPVGSITDIHVDLRPRSGCEVLEIDGPTTMSTLRVGQAFSFFACLRVSSSETQDLSVTLKDPLLEHSLDATDLRQELYIAEKLNAKFAHLLSIQVFHKNPLNPPGTWSYTETPLIATTKLGRLAPPSDLSLDVHRRRVFHVLNKVNNEMAMKEVENLAICTLDKREDMKYVIQRMAKEIHWHRTILEYEHSARQRLPLCSDLIEIASVENHEHIQTMLDAKTNKCKDMAVM